eukprot:11233685-Prorocentrum_lima.AAC.1
MSPPNNTLATPLFLSMICLPRCLATGLRASGQSYSIHGLLPYSEIARLLAPSSMQPFFCK